MAFGDVGGIVTELVLTCKTPDSGDVAIEKGDAVVLTDAYTVVNEASAEDAVFGQALAPATLNGAAIPVKVRGICVFEYTGTAPAIDGVTGVVASGSVGKVKSPVNGYGRGIVIKVDESAKTVHVLL